MSLIVTFNGANYIIPEPGETGWGSNLDSYFVAIAAGCLQKTGGSFTLSAETDFGASFGLKSLYYKSRASNVASTGAVRLANAETGIVWRRADNMADLALTVNASNQLTFNGTPIESNSLTNTHILVGNVSNIATDVAMSGDVSITNTGATSVNSVQAGVITNTMVNASAAIAYSKLALTNSIVNADINTSAAIVYSKLNLSNSIVNADINSSAAIAYSKLNLSGSIVNADISASAAIAITKVAPGTANQLIGANSGATANEYKTLSGTSNQVSVTNGVGTITLATPQNIDSTATPTFASETLTATSNQLVLGTTRTITITAPTPATSSRTWTLPDLTTSPTFAALEGTQTFSGSKTFSSNILTSSSIGLVLKDDSTHTVTVKATNSTTNYTFSLPTTAGSSNQYLTTDGSGNLTWTNAAGTGTVNSGTAGRLGLYATSTNAISDTYVQNANNINVTIAAHAALSSTRTYTIPELGTNGTFGFLEGTQTFSGTKTFSANTAFTGGTGGVPGLHFSGGSSDATLYQNAFFSSGGGGTIELNSYTQTTITTAKTIYTRDAGSAFLFVYGSDGAGNDYTDFIFAQNVSGGTVTALFSGTAKGSPTARTYSQSGLNVQVAMASGTYTTRVLAFDIQAR